MPDPYPRQALVAARERGGEGVLFDRAVALQHIDDGERHLGVVGPGGDALRGLDRGALGRGIGVGAFEASAQRIRHGEALEGFAIALSRSIRGGAIAWFATTADPPVRLFPRPWR